MRTEVLPVGAASLARAASLLCAGEVVAFPTETVYGLGADAQNPKAVAKIFAAKDRPADNPLIAHIAQIDALYGLVEAVPQSARQLMDAFWPGPLTLVLPAADRVPRIVTAGLSTVAVRMPSHADARALLVAAGRPIAAPSANRSGRPSPTTAAHVLADMDGRIPLILDGGLCGVGVESTVLDVTGPIPRLLRPGGVTLEMLRDAVGPVQVDPAVLAPLAQDAAAASPGMRHRHYAPRARVTVVTGAQEAVGPEVKRRYDAALETGHRPAILCAHARAPVYAPRRVHALGADAGEMARGLFDAFRALDGEGVTHILAEGVAPCGMGLAYMNRLLRAADFDCVRAE